MLSSEEILRFSNGKAEASDVYDASLLSSGNYVRIANAMRKAQRGEKVSLITIGGSVTDGGDAVPKKECCFATLVFKWWKEAFPNAQFETVNAGIGASGSLFATARFERDILPHEPDFAVVEFACNDLSKKPYLYETHEGVVRRLLAMPKQPGVLLFFITHRTFTNVDELHIPTGIHYDLPMISAKNGFRYMVEQCGTDIHDLMGTRGYHPNNNGHALMADLICHELEKIKASLDTIPTDVPPLQEPLFSDRFTEAKLLGPNNLTPLQNDGWETNADLSWFLKDGWTAAKPGSKISFELEGSAIFLNYKERNDGKGGLAKVYIDGVEVDTLQNYFRWCGRIMHRLLYDGERSKHRVDVVFTGEPFENGSGEFFDIYGFITA